MIFASGGQYLVDPEHSVNVADNQINMYTRFSFGMRAIKVNGVQLKRNLDRSGGRKLALNMDGHIMDIYLNATSMTYSQ